MNLTTDLIPTSGVHITEEFYPAGYRVARYDADGLCSDGRWFPTIEKAEVYATMLRRAP